MKHILTNMFSAFRIDGELFFLMGEVKETEEISIFDCHRRLNGMLIHVFQEIFYGLALKVP